MTSAERQLLSSGSCSAFLLVSLCTPAVVRILDIYPPRTLFCALTLPSISLINRMLKHTSPYPRMLSETTHVPNCICGAHCSAMPRHRTHQARRSSTLHRTFLKRNVHHESENRAPAAHDLVREAPPAGSPFNFEGKRGTIFNSRKEVCPRQNRISTSDSEHTPAHCSTPP